MLAETRAALTAALAMLEKLQWSAYGRCPVCNGLDPFVSKGGPASSHGFFGHSSECELAKMLGKHHEWFSCDCFVLGRMCLSTPLYNGRQWNELSFEERSAMLSKVA